MLETHAREHPQAHGSDGPAGGGQHAIVFRAFLSGGIGHFGAVVVGDRFHFAFTEALHRWMMDFGCWAGRWPMGGGGAAKRMVSFTRVWLTERIPVGVNTSPPSPSLSLSLFPITHTITYTHISLFFKSIIRDCSLTHTLNSTQLTLWHCHRTPVRPTPPLRSNPPRQPPPPPPPPPSSSSCCCCCRRRRRMMIWVLLKEKKKKEEEEEGEDEKGMH